MSELRFGVQGPKFLHVVSNVVFGSGLDRAVESESFHASLTTDLFLS